MLYRRCPPGSNHWIKLFPGPRLELVLVLHSQISCPLYSYCLVISCDLTTSTVSVDWPNIPLPLFPSVFVSLSPRRPPWKRLSFETQSWLQKWPPPNASAKRPNTLSESELAVHVSAAGSLNCAMETAAKDLLRNSPVAWPHFHSSVLTL